LVRISADRLLRVEIRDADSGTDTMAGDARLVKIKVEYAANTESD
jgi:hypothetical protein